LREHPPFRRFVTARGLLLVVGALSSGLALLFATAALGFLSVLGLIASSSLARCPR